MPSRARRTAAAALVAATALAGAPAADATFPGKNGRVAFQRALPNQAEDIFSARLDGSGLRRLTFTSPRRVGPGYDGFQPITPAWSADGRRIAYAGPRRRGDRWSLVVMQADGSRKFAVPGVEDASSPAWSPDGRMLAFERHGGETFGIWVVRLTGTGLRRIHEWGQHPTWSPNGRWIAFSGTVARGGCNTVMLANARTGATRVLHENPRSNCAYGSPEPDFSPDGSRLLVALNMARSDPDDIYSIDVRTGELRRLTRTPDVFEHEQAWSPDGRLFAARRIHGEYERLFVYDLRGRVVARHRLPGWNWAWQPLPRRR